MDEICECGKSYAEHAKCVETHRGLSLLSEGLNRREFAFCVNVPMECFGRYRFKRAENPPTEWSALNEMTHRFFESARACKGITSHDFA